MPDTQKQDAYHVLRTFSYGHEGEVYGRLTILYTYSKQMRAQRMIVATCMCNCGKIYEGYFSPIRRGKVGSCGCLRVETTRKLGQSHHTHGACRGHMGTRWIYNTWKGMLHRCENVESSAYHNYGGRGITVCERWHDYTLFEKDIVSMRKGVLSDTTLSLDRIDNNKGYAPENCRMATCAEQSRNMRTNVIVLYKEQQYVLTDLVALHQIPYMTVYKRICRGWTVEDAIETPIIVTRRNSLYKGGGI